MEGLSSTGLPRLVSIYMDKASRLAFAYYPMPLVSLFLLLMSGPDQLPARGRSYQEVCLLGQVARFVLVLLYEGRVVRARLQGYWEHFRGC